MSLIVVLTALPARFSSIPFAEVFRYWPIAVNLLAGSLVGTWIGAIWATRMQSATTLVVSHFGVTGGHWRCRSQRESSPAANSSSRRSCCYWLSTSR